MAITTILLLTTATNILMVVLSLSTSYQKQTDSSDMYIENTDPVLLTPKRVSHFLAETMNPHQYHHRRSLKPADHCHKDNEVCDAKYGPNSTCCGNKCFDLNYEKNYCGNCKIKCKYTYSCCNGQCVDLAYDKRHCGTCNNNCVYGQYCIYGMCDYA